MTPEAPNPLDELLATWFTAERGAVALRIAILLLLGWMLARLARSASGRISRSLHRPDLAPLAEKAVYYVVLGLVAASALSELGFDLSVLLGAAGVFTVAVGFAAQTSMSNLISGIFLVMERAIRVGEVIRVGQTTGEVVEIDWLSIKLRTFDNLLVRVPNETLVKAEITNMSRYPIRRVDVLVEVGYGEDLARVEEIVLAVVDSDPNALEEPLPMVVPEAFGESGVRLKLMVWAARENWFDLKNRLHPAIQAAFRREAIEIPYPHRVVVTARPD